MSSQRKFKVHIRGVTAETEHRLHRSCWDLWFKGLEL
jgi:hypothetical protein